MIKTYKSGPRAGTHFLLKAGVAVVLLSILSAPVMAQGRRGAIQPAAHADQEPINSRPNPYETQRNFGTLPDGRSWGSVSAVNIDIDGINVWAGDRCGTNSCATSDVDPIVKLDPDGNVLTSFGAGLIIWPPGMDGDSEGNGWGVDNKVVVLYNNHNLEDYEIRYNNHRIGS